MARKKKLDWKIVEGEKNKTWTCVANESINARIIQKGEEFFYECLNNGRVVASGVSRGFVSASGNAELRIRSCLNEDLGV